MPQTPKTVLFLCTGNYYRSRFAEILFNALAAKIDLAWRAESRGLALHAGNIGALSAAAAARLAAVGIATDGPLRLPMQVKEVDFQRADLIVGLKEAEHRPFLQQHHSAWVSRVRFWHIDDADCASPDHALPRLEQHVSALVHLLRRRGHAG